MKARLFGKTERLFIIRVIRVIINKIRVINVIRVHKVIMIGLNLLGLVI